MKKNIRYLIIMLAVLVVLGGGAAVLLLTQPAADEDASSSSLVASEMVTDRETSEVATVTVENPNASYVMVPVDDGTAKSDRSHVVLWAKELSVSLVFLRPLASDFAVNMAVSIEASKNLGEQEDLAQFGLSGVGAAKVDIQYTDGTSDSFVMGNEAGETSGRYLLKDGVVYITASYSSGLLETPFYFFETDVYTVADRVEETVDSEGSSSTSTLEDVLYHMELSGANAAEPIVIDYDSSKVSSYLITQPVMAESGTNTLTEIATALKSLSAEAVVAAGRTQETLEQYGLAEPYAQITFDMNGEEHTLAVSEANSSGNRYLIADDIDLVYEVTGDSVNAWAEAGLMDLRMSYVWLPNINNVSTLTMRVADGTEYRFDVEQVVNEEDSTEDKTVYDLVVTNGDGQSVDYENYQPFYQMVLSQAVLSTDEATYDAENLVLEITFEYFDGSDPDVITYCVAEGQDQRYAALLNGGYNGIVRRSDVDTLLEKLPLVYQDQSVE